MFDLNPIQILASIPAIIIVFSVFGYAEAKVATWFGDPTPRMAGRLTLSPLAHLDLIGTICIILVGSGLKGWLLIHLTLKTHAVI